MSSSYFSQPETHLDPELFDGSNMMLPDVRSELSSLLLNHLSEHYSVPHEWTHAWLAGSGASYQWKAQRDPADLDMLVGIDYPKFRYHNQEMSRLSDKEISTHVTDCLRKHLTPSTARWKGKYEVTWYSNPHSTDIRSINPYAAYDVLHDKWDVEPDPSPSHPSPDGTSDRDEAMGKQAISRYNDALTALETPGLPAHLRTEHERRAKDALAQGAALFDDIHDGRRTAFSYGGLGYADPANYRWQSGKESGVVPSLKRMKEMFEMRNLDEQMRRYGVQLPDTESLLLRAMVEDR